MVVGRIFHEIHCKFHISSAKLHVLHTKYSNVIENRDQFSRICCLMPVKHLIINLGGIAFSASLCILCLSPFHHQSGFIKVSFNIGHISEIVTISHANLS